MKDVFEPNFERPNVHGDILRELNSARRVITLLNTDIDICFLILDGCWYIL